jgi:Arc/MetJ family transcription regulator
MHTTIELDDDLMQTAFELSGIQSEQALIEQAIKDLIKNYQAVLTYPNEQTKAAMLDVRAKQNIENVTLEQLQYDFKVQ